MFRDDPASGSDVQVVLLDEGADGAVPVGRRQLLMSLHVAGLRREQFPPVLRVLGLLVLEILPPVTEVGHGVEHAWAQPKPLGLGSVVVSLVSQPLDELFEVGGCRLEVTWFHGFLLLHSYTRPATIRASPAADCKGARGV